MRLRGHIYKYVLIALTAVGITTAAVMSGCPVYRVIPLYVSLFVMYLQTRASRFSFLLGGCNAAYYAVVYFFLGLYGMALYSILMACPIQIVTYIRWKQRPYAHSALLRRLNGWQRLGWVLGFGAAWTALYWILHSFGSEYLILDNTLSVIGVVGNIASMLYLIEFPYVQVVNYVLNIVLYVQMIQEDPRQWTFLIYSVYALVCCAVSAVYMQRLYNLQRREKQAG